MSNELKRIKRLEGYSVFGGYDVCFENRYQYEWLIEQTEKAERYEKALRYIDDMLLGGECKKIVKIALENNI